MSRIVLCLHIDAELSAEAVTFESSVDFITRSTRLTLRALVRDLQLLEPYGAGNPRPVFLAHNLRIISEPRLIGEKHLKMYISGPAGRPTETIWWNGARTEPMVAVTNGITMAYTIESNRWNGDTFLQLSEQEVRPALDRLAIAN
jgi:single-stranded-DNA-specific exonuclease